MPVRKPEVSKKTKGEPERLESGVTEKVQISEGEIYVEKGVTKNMGDYNSARVTVGMRLPIHYNEETLKQATTTIAVVMSIVDQELEKQVDELVD